MSENTWKKLLQTIFQKSNSGNHDEAYSQFAVLRNVHDQVGREQFFAEFSVMLKNFLGDSSVEEVEVNRCLDVVASFSVSFNENKRNSHKEMHEFLFKIIKLTLYNVDEAKKPFRYHFCFLLNKLLQLLVDEICMEQDLYLSIYQTLNEQFKDGDTRIQLLAVKCMSWLQKPAVNNCPAIESFLLLLRGSGRVRVKCAVVEHIHMTAGALSELLERTATDCSWKVRRDVYRVICRKVQVQALTISQRVLLLDNGLRDKSESVRQAATQMLTRCWLQHFDGSVLKLLGSLDVDLATSTAELAIEVLFGDNDVQLLVQQFAEVLDEQRLIEINKISPQAMHYWRCLAQRVKASAVDVVENLQKILPSGTEFADYVLMVFQQFCARNENQLMTTADDFAVVELLKMLKLTKLFDDEHSVAKIKEVLEVMLLSDVFTLQLVENLVECLGVFAKSIGEQVAKVFEVISEISHPLDELANGEITNRQQHLELESIRLAQSLSDLHERLEESIAKEDVEEEAYVRCLLENQRQQLEDVDQRLEDQTTLSQKIEKTRDAEKKMKLKVLCILSSLLKNPRMKMYPSINMAYHEIVLPGIQNVEPAIRMQAVKCIGLVGILDMDLAKQNMTLLLQAMHVDAEEIRSSALMCVVDFLLCFGLEFLDEDMSEEIVEIVPESCDMLVPVSQERCSCSMVNVIDTITRLLKDPAILIRFSAAEGLCKLLLHDKLASPNILMRLLVLWNDARCGAEHNLHFLLSTFLRKYSFGSFSHQCDVTAAFVPSVVEILKQKDADAVPIVNLLVNLTAYCRLSSLVDLRDDDNPHHENLAFVIIDRILHIPGSPHIKVWCLILTKLDYPQSYIPLKVLHNSLKRIILVISDGYCKRKLRLLMKKLNRKLVLCPENEVHR